MKEQSSTQPEGSDGETACDGELDDIRAAAIDVTKFALKTVAVVWGACYFAYFMSRR